MVTDTSQPRISVVIPAYKQEKTIKEDIVSIDKALSYLHFPYEIIVVVDGFVDNTYKRAKQVKNSKVRVYGYKDNIGKGSAVRYGMLRAKGEIIGFIDSGMDLNPNGIQMLINHMFWYEADIIIGSKLHPVSQVDYPTYRLILSWGYRTLIRILFGLRVRDTQVGMKFYKKKVVFDVFPRLLVKQFAFDIETLAVAYSLGYKRIFEAPIKLDFNRKSSITPSKLAYVIFLMLWDTMAVFYRIKILRYYQNKKI